MILEVVVLVGGSGSRLWPLTEERPKPLLPVLGRPMLDWVLAPLNQPFVGRITLAVGYKAEAFQGYESFRPIQVVAEEFPRGTGGALRALQPDIQGPVLVLNGDTFLEFELSAFWEQHRTQNPHLSMAVCRVENAGRYGRVVLDEEGAVRAFLEKDSTFSGAAWINAGAYLFSPEAWSELPDKPAYSLEQEVFPHWVGERFRTWKCAGRFSDVGTHEAYLEAHLRSGGRISPQAQVADDAELVGPVYLGPGCRIGAGARIEESVLEKDVVVGAGSRLRQCILAQGLTVAAGSVVERQTWSGVRRQPF
ncbi:MAG: NDP-sugar synthase [Candidatus Eremiobacteraeota bacterium]|nr:NDP-sugar synthase [Candidatus Eremiobacteraeota bacterium]MCW5868796.1 NDP-sugar synthase [Candidatus Eremiobacteraeota bacterium]